MHIKTAHLKDKKQQLHIKDNEMKQHPWSY